MWGFFDKIYCINLDKRKDRWGNCVNEFGRVGLVCERFTAYDGDNHHLAFNKSQYEVLKKAVEDGGQRILILEDDVIFKSCHHLESACNQLPLDWDCLWLGANLNGTKQERFSGNLFTIKNAFTTHAVAYSRNMAEWIVSNFNPDEFPIYDEWLRINVQSEYKCFVIAPMIAWQRPDHSDIWGHHADYTRCFSEGEYLLK